MIRIAACLIVLLSWPSLLHAQDIVGFYDMDWATLTIPTSSDSPRLTHGLRVIEIRHAAGSQCPPNASHVVNNPTGVGDTWCLYSDTGSNIIRLGEDSGGNQYDGGLEPWPAQEMFVVGVNHGQRGADTTHAVGKRRAAPTPTPPPTAGGLKISVTAPKAGATVSGYNWVVAWCDVCSGTSVFAVYVDGVERGRVSTTSKGPVSIRWDTRAVSNNANHAVTVKVTNGTKSGTSAGVTVRVANP